MTERPKPLKNSSEGTPNIEQNFGRKALMVFVVYHLLAVGVYYVVQS